jgi:hypothetical protein
LESEEVSIAKTQMKLKSYPVLQTKINITLKSASKVEPMIAYHTRQVTDKN